MPSRAPLARAPRVVLLDLAWPLWLAVLVAMVAVFAAAAVAALLGKQELSAATPPVPSDAVAGVQADVHTIKTAAQRGRHA